MTLPAPGSPWPPLPLAPALKRFATWDAWWSGDPDTLAEHYGAANGGHGIGRHINRPAQYAGGVVGRAARMWWGRPSAANEPEAKLHVPLAGDICRASADLLFSEPLKATSADGPTSERLEVLLDDGAQAKLLEAAEVCAALGGVYLRPVYDKTISDRAWLDAVAPDAALPEWRWGRLGAVTFWRVVQKNDGQVWRHLERHEPGWIVHALYQGTDREIGHPVPLQDVEATAGYAQVVNEASAVPTNYSRLDVTYIPNMLPNRRWRTAPQLAPMGRSDLDGCEPLLDALDETYSGWMRDVRLGKGRVFAAANLLDDHGPGRGASFDPDREWFANVPGAQLSKDAQLTVVQFAIRVEQHRDTAAGLLEQTLRHAGYSGQTLGEKGEVAVTATEVNARERRSFITRGRKIGYWRPGLAGDAFPALLAIDGDVFGRKVDLDKPINVEFADSVSEDILTLANTVDVLNRAAAASTATKVKMLHPEWSDIQVADEVALVDGAAGPTVGPPFDYAADGLPTETDDQRAAAGAP